MHAQHSQPGTIFKRRMRSIGKCKYLEIAALHKLHKEVQVVDQTTLPPVLE